MIRDGSAKIASDLIASVRQPVQIEGDAPNAVASTSVNSKEPLRPREPGRFRIYSFFKGSRRLLGSASISKNPL